MRKRDPLQLEDPKLTGGERSFRIGWQLALKRTDGSRPTISPEFVARQGRALRVIDVRSQTAVLGALGHVPGSDWVPLEEAGALHARIGTLEPVVLVCDDGQRSLTLASWLEEAGLGLVAAMEGGMRGWREHGLSSERDPDLLGRKGLLSPLTPWATTDAAQAFTLEEIVEHVGHPRSVRWIKVAAFLLNGRMACIDGRDHSAVVGSPGGDAGELVLALGALERVRGEPLTEEQVDQLVRRRVEAFGRFAFHTDTTAGNRMIAAIRRDPRTAAAVAGMSEPLAFREFFAQPPAALQAPLLEILSQSQHIGCGHLRLTSERAAEWGVRQGLTGEVLRSALALRWAGAPGVEATPLTGGHSEGAVLNLRVSGELDAYSLVPLVAPSIAGRQLFVNHPDVATFLRRQLSRFLSRQDDLFAPPSAEALFEAMQALHQQQLNATLGALAAGLPIFEVVVHHNRDAEVRHVGTVPKA